MQDFPVALSLVSPETFITDSADSIDEAPNRSGGTVRLALGSSGVPETYVVDGKGTIVYQHIGEIRPEHVGFLLEKLKDAEQ